MNHQHGSVRRGYLFFQTNLKPSITLVSVLAFALVFASLFVPARKALADDDIERHVAMMAKIGFATSPSFSPDGSRVAFVTNITGVPQV